jgi:hypothetical protein
MMVQRSRSLIPIGFVGHDVVEVITSDESIIIEVSFEEHMVDLVFGKVLSQFLSDLLEFSGGDLSLNYIKITDRLTSNEPQTFSISARLSLSLILAVANLKNSAKSIPPD